MKESKHVRVANQHICSFLTHMKETLSHDTSRLNLMFSLLTVVHRVAASFGHPVALIQSSIHRLMRKAWLMVRIIRMIVIRVQIM